MSKKKTGGPAFPREKHITWTHENDGPQITAHKEGGHPGMTLLDYIAMKAMQGYFVTYDANQTDPLFSFDASVARQAYEVATLMLEEKNRRERDD